MTFSDLCQSQILSFPRTNCVFLESAFRFEIGSWPDAPTRSADRRLWASGVGRASGASADNSSSGSCVQTTSCWHLSRTGVSLSFEAPQFG